MYRQHFGLTHAPLSNNSTELFDDGPIDHLKGRFQWLLDSPGIGLLTGEPGVGKTAALRQLTQTLNPHRYLLIYTPETDFGRLDLYRNLAIELGLEPAFRRAQLWRDIKARILELQNSKRVLPIWIIDEAQNLPNDFFKDFPAFLNFAFDAQSMITVWFVGHPRLIRTLRLAPYEALASRIQVRAHIKPFQERERFTHLIKHALQQAGCQQTLLSDSAMEILRQASAGKPRQAGQLLITAMQLAVPKGLNHLPDDLIQQAIEELQ
jgi:MSHA biogenesis protein MshM